MSSQEIISSQENNGTGMAEDTDTAENLVDQVLPPCLKLIKSAVRLNAGKSEYILDDVTLGGLPVGRWQVTAEQIDTAEAIAELRLNKAGPALLDACRAAVQLLDDMDGTVGERYLTVRGSEEVRFQLNDAIAQAILPGMDEDPLPDKERLPNSGNSAITRRQEND